MFCPNCGAKSNGKFCPNCGTALGSTETNIIDKSETIINNYYSSPTNVNHQSGDKPKRICPKCHNGNITYQTITEQKKTGCLVVLIYIILAISCIGWLILIPMLASKKDKTVTYAVCQSCGHRWKIN